jgi:hypothetical protein
MGCFRQAKPVLWRREPIAILTRKQVKTWHEVCFSYKKELSLQQIKRLTIIKQERK